MRNISLFLLCLSLWSFAETPTPRHKPSTAAPKTTPLPQSKGQGEKTEGPRPQASSPSTTAISSSRTEIDSLGLKKDKCLAQHSIEAFLQISSSSAPQPHPAGGIYFLSDLREVRQIFYLASPQSWPEQVTFFPDGVPFFKLSPDGKFLLVGSHTGGDEQYDLYLISTREKTVQPLIVDRTKRIESIAWSSSSKWFAYTSNLRNKIDMDLYQYDLASKSSKLLAELSGSNAVVDISPDDSQISFETYRSVTDSDVQVFQIKTQKVVNLTSHEGHGSHHEGYFTQDSQSLFLLSDEINGIHQLYLLNLANRTKKPFTGGKWGVEGLLLHPKRTALGYVVNEEGYSRLGGFEIDRAGNKQKLVPIPSLGKTVIESVAFAYAKEGLFFANTSSVEPLDIWQFNGKNKVKWTGPKRPLIEPQCLVTEGLVRFPSFDRLEIPAFLYRPKNNQEMGPIPFLVYVHGGPEAQQRPYFSKTFQYLLSRGFGILATNIRGSTGYGREFTLLDNYKKRMDSVSDVIEGTKWLLKQRFTKEDTIGIFGGSYGGFLVLRSIEVEPKLFAAASESVGIANFVTFLERTKPYRRALREVEYGPLSDKEFLKSISPTEYVDKIVTPLLIFHGANDPRVPVEETEQMVKELKSRDIPVEYKIFADEGHGNTKLRNIMDQARQMVFFFDKHLMKNTEKK